MQCKQLIATAASAIEGKRSAQSWPLRVRAVPAYGNRRGALPRRIELAVKGLFAERQAASAKR
jgi:hypothetical protein